MGIQSKGWPLAAMALLGLSACGGGGGNASGVSCRSLAALVDGLNTDINCTGTCAVDRAGAAADGNSGSAARLRMEGTAAGSVAVSARASGGGTFAAGTVVGVIYEVGESNQDVVTFQLNTYLAGVAQDSFTLRTDARGSFATPAERASNTATRPYDTVEFKYMRGSGSSSGSAGVYEFCSD